MCNRIEVGDVVECIDDTIDTNESTIKQGFLTKGSHYKVTEIVGNEHLKLEGFGSYFLFKSRFKLVEPCVVEAKQPTDHSLMIKGAIVECINNSTDNGVHGDKLKVGKTYVVSRRVTSNGRHIEVEGIEGEPYCSDRFKLVMTNRKFKPTPKVTVRQLEAFRKMVTFNQIIVDEGLYFDEDSQSWLSRKQSDGWWVNYIRGAWVTFLEFEKMALNKSISDWVEGK